jgi:Protein of unknown function (DUF2695)
MGKKSRAASLPMSAELFGQLLDVLDERLSEDDCDHTHRVTEDFLVEAGGDVEAEEVMAWLVDRGGVCDCEVLANLEDEFRP